MENGIIMKAISGFYYVETGDETITCKARGRFRRDRITPLVGDVAEISITGDGEGVLEKIRPRKNAFIRPPIANLDQLVIIASAALPVTDPFLIDRMTAVAAQKDCDCVICINKKDLEPGDELFDTYSRAGFKTVRTSAETGEGIPLLLEAIEERVSAFTGNSGVGKSSILNMLEPGFDIRVGEVSEKLGRGRHTTRHVELYRLHTGAVVADTPGFSSFDTDMMELTDKDSISRFFQEFSPFEGLCRFDDCAHVKEKGCAVLEAVKDGLIPATRHKSYVRLYEQAGRYNVWDRPTEK